MSINDRDDTGDDQVDEFYVEPWSVEVRSDSLTLADRTPSSEYFLSASVPVVIGVAVALVTMWWGSRRGWEVRLLGYVMAGLIVTGAFPFVAKGLRGPQSYLFDRRRRSVRLNDELLGSWSDIQTIEITTTYHPAVEDASNQHRPLNRRHRLEYRLQLRVKTRTLLLVTGGAITTAERLGQALADFIGVPLTRG